MREWRLRVKTIAKATLLSPRTPRPGAHPAEEHSHDNVTEAVAHVQDELAEAEAFREHEALATDEGMPSGQLDEDPPPPVVKSTAAGE